MNLVVAAVAAPVASYPRLVQAHARTLQAAVDEKMTLDFSRCRSVWIPDEERWSPPPPHVEEGVRQIVAHPYFLLADDMGLMKSAQALIAAQFLHDAGEIDRLIVVAPASVRPLVWYDKEIGQIAEQAFDDKNVFVSEFHAKVRQWQRGPADARQLRIIVSSYEFLRTHGPELLSYCGPRTMLVLDESSAVRGPDSAQTDAMMRLRWQTNKKGRPVLGLPRCGRVLLLNGTPTAESPMDLFSQANLLHPSILECRWKTHFKARYAVQQPVMERGRPMMRYGRVVQSVAGWPREGIADLQRRLAPYVLRREAKGVGVDFALPPVALEVRLTPKTWRYYCSMRDEMVAWLERGGVSVAHQAGVKSVRLSQITSGFLGGIEDPNIGETRWEGEPEEIEPGHMRQNLVLPINYQTQEIGREKLDFALEWQAELLRAHPDLKLLTWCRFVPELRRYILEVDARFQHPIGVVCGQRVFEESSVRREREHALKLLHPKTAPAGACTVGATQGTGAMGLNFTACRTVLDMSYDFSPWKKRQGDARVNRSGQTGPVSFFYLVAVGPKGQKTIDHHILLHRLGKMDVNDLTTSGWVRMLREE